MEHLHSVHRQRLKAPTRDLTDQRFGKLTALSFAGFLSLSVTGKRQAYWDCKCDCGNASRVRAATLINGATRSCGCLPRETRASTTHGMTGTRVYRIWKGIRTRCLNRNHHTFNNYGGRGILLCERWASFENFYADMGDPPGPRSSIDRINNDGNYEPGNCRWASDREQANNKRLKAPRITPIKDLTGMSFGDLVVVSFAGFTEESGSRRASVWACRCACGSETVKRGNSLLMGLTRSCGIGHRFKSSAA